MWRTDDDLLRHCRRCGDLGRQEQHDLVRFFGLLLLLLLPLGSLQKPIHLVFGALLSGGQFWDQKSRLIVASRLAGNQRLAKQRQGKDEVGEAQHAVRELQIVEVRPKEGRGGVEPLRPDQVRIESDEQHQ